MRRGKLLQPEEGVNLPAMALDSGMVLQPHFDHEKLDVYQLELNFLSRVTQFLADPSSRSLPPTRIDPEQYRVHEGAASLAMPLEHEYPGKASLFWVRHEHIFQLKAH
jgi:hypothetical protein